MKRTLILTLFLLTLLIPLSTRASDFVCKKFAPRSPHVEVDPEAVILDFEGNVVGRDALSMDLESCLASTGNVEHVSNRGLNPKNTC